MWSASVHFCDGVWTTFVLVSLYVIVCVCSECVLGILRNVWLYLRRKHCYHLWGRKDGTKAGLGGLQVALSHLSQVLLSMLHFAQRTIHRSDPLLLGVRGQN